LKIAQFKTVGSVELISVLSQEDIERFPYIYAPTKYVRISEWTDVTFVPRNREEHAREQLEALSAAETELRSKFAQKLHEIENERSKLLSLTYQPEAA
jgi:hypothetical protein